jgi:hypothetical protein
MAVQAVIVRRAHERQAPARKSMAQMVEGSVLLLQLQRVLVVDLGIRHVDRRQDLIDAQKFDDASLKLKFRMNGMTHLKTKSGKATLGKDGSSRINFDTVGSTVFEGGEVLHFELCKQRLLGSSRTLAKCAMPLSSALGAVMDSNLCGKVWNLDLFAADPTGDVIGNLAVYIGFRTSRLESAGGPSMLKSIRLPASPEIRNGSVFSFNEDSEEALAYMRKVDDAQKFMQAVFDVARAIARVSCENAALQASAIGDMSDNASTSCGSHSTLQFSLCDSDF